MSNTIKHNFYTLLMHLLQVLALFLPLYGENRGLKTNIIPK